jgi:hypothetical protein
MLIILSNEKVLHEKVNFVAYLLFQIKYIIKNINMIRKYNQIKPVLNNVIYRIDPFSTIMHVTLLFFKTN